MTQTWRDLLFAHWPIDVDRLRPLVRAPFVLDLFQGEAWLGIVPFQMSNVSLRGIPRAAVGLRVSRVERSAPTCAWARSGPVSTSSAWMPATGSRSRPRESVLNLPLFLATMKVTPQASGVLYESRRDDEQSQAELVTTYRPIEPPFEPAKGSLEYFLTERYCLYNLDQRETVPPGDPSSGMATPACGGRARSQHDGRGIGHPPPESAAVAAFLGTSGHGRLGAIDARGLRGVSDCAALATAVFSCR